MELLITQQKKALESLKFKYETKITDIKDNSKKSLEELFAFGAGPSIPQHLVLPVDNNTIPEDSKSGQNNTNVETNQVDDTNVETKSEQEDNTDSEYVTINNEKPANRLKNIMDKLNEVAGLTQDSSYKLSADGISDILSYITAVYKKAAEQSL